MLQFFSIFTVCPPPECFSLYHPTLCHGNCVIYVSVLAMHLTAEMFLSNVGEKAFTLVLADWPFQMHSA